MQSIKVRFNHKRLGNYRMFFFVWLGIGIASISANPNNFFAYGYALVCIAYAALYFYEKNRNYLTIEDGTIRKSHITKKSIALEQVTEIKKFAGEIIFRVDQNKELRFDMNLMNQEDLDELKEQFPQLAQKNRRENANAQ